VVGNVVATPTLNIAEHIAPGRVTVVSQSGGMGVNVVNIAQGRGVGIRALVSVGNECDVDAARSPTTRTPR
jgi:acyl-CoA synthetase (NDP forming)